MADSRSGYKTFRSFLRFWVVLGAVVGLVGTVGVVADRFSAQDAGPADSAAAPAPAGGAIAGAEDGFRATFPSAPQREVGQSEALGAPMKKVSYASESSAGLFGVEVGYVPDGVDVGNGQTALETVLESIGTGNQGQVTGSAATTVDGMAARDYAMTTGAGFVKGRLILRDRRIYHVAAATRTADVAGYDQFLASFRLV